MTEKRTLTGAFDAEFSPPFDSKLRTLDVGSGISSPYRSTSLTPVPTLHHLLYFLSQTTVSRHLVGRCCLSPLLDTASRPSRLSLLDVDCSGSVVLVAIDAHAAGIGAPPTAAPLAGHYWPLLPDVC
ncbi:hypothetical protein RIF29_16096 [Crotalaria pallida]|uniref:Uncharacterized protein n=1 Tax=Crotalaria pallida TaxID=3830 RepID=A0AAN9IF92_CROPI